jgi:hypothetical protein
LRFRKINVDGLRIRKYSLRIAESETPHQPTTMKTTYTVKTNNGYRHLTNKREALRIARVMKSDGWPTFVKAGEKVIFSYNR